MKSVGPSRVVTDEWAAGLFSLFATPPDRGLRRRVGRRLGFIQRAPDFFPFSLQLANAVPHCVQKHSLSTRLCHRKKWVVLEFCEGSVFRVKPSIKQDFHIGLRLDFGSFLVQLRYVLIEKSPEIWSHLWSTAGHGLLPFSSAAEPESITEIPRRIVTTDCQPLGSVFPRDSPDALSLAATRRTLNSSGIIAHANSISGGTLPPAASFSHWSHMSRSVRMTSRRLASTIVRNSMSERSLSIFPTACLPSDVLEPLVEMVATTE